MRRVCLPFLASLVLGGCAARETEIHTTAAGSGGSGVSDASEISAPGTSIAAGAAIGNPGR